MHQGIKSLMHKQIIHDNIDFLNIICIAVVSVMFITKKCKYYIVSFNLITYLPLHLEINTVSMVTIPPNMSPAINH